MPKKISLSVMEWKLMDRLWESAPKTITQLTRELEPDTGWAKGTVISFLGRLVAKGAVRYEEGAKARQYYPAVSYDAVAAHETESFLRRVYGGSVGLMINSLAGRDALSRQDIQALRSLLDSLAKEEN